MIVAREARGMQGDVEAGVKLWKAQALAAKGGRGVEKWLGSASR